MNLKVDTTEWIPKHVVDKYRRKDGWIYAEDIPEALDWLYGDEDPEELEKYLKKYKVFASEGTFMFKKKLCFSRIFYQIPRYGRIRRDR